VCGGTVIPPHDLDIVVILLTLDTRRVKKNNNNNNLQYGCLSNGNISKEIRKARRSSY